MTPRYHGTTQKLNLALEMARGIMKLQKRLKGTDSECRHEIDGLAQMAQYMVLEVEKRDAD